MADRFPFMRVSIRGVSRVRLLTTSLRGGVFASIAQGRIEKLIVKRTKDRFAPLGANPRAQKDPVGRTWRRLAENTRRRRNRDRSQVLVETNALRNSIVILQKGMGKALGRPTGADSRVGISPSALGSRGEPVSRYGAVHQAGSARVPQRRFLGVSQDDAKAVEAVIQRIMARAERGVLAGIGVNEAARPTPGGFAAILVRRPLRR